MTTYRVQVSGPGGPPHDYPMETAEQLRQAVERHEQEYDTWTDIHVWSPTHWFSDHNARGWLFCGSILTGTGGETLTQRCNGIWERCVVHGEATTTTPAETRA